MVVLGLLLMVAAAAAVVVVTVEQSTATATSVTLMDRTFQLTQWEVYVAGIVTALVFMAGLAMMMKGMRRTLVVRRDARRSKAAARERVQRLEEEKRELERKLEETPAAAPAAGAPDAEPVTGRHAAVPPQRTDGPPTEPTAPPRTDRHPDDQLVAGAPRNRDERR